jgi:hypothetical protein
MHLRMAEAMGMTGLVRERWSPGPKLGFDQMVAPVPGIIDSSGIRANLREMEGWEGRLCTGLVYEEWRLLGCYAVWLL